MYRHSAGACDAGPEEGSQHSDHSFNLLVGYDAVDFMRYARESRLSSYIAAITHACRHG